MGDDQQFGAGDPQARQWAMFLHLSQIANCLIPPVGIVAPIVMWQMKKDEMPSIDAHGKNVVNWLISSLIYFVACIPFMFIGIGFVMAMMLALAAIVFPIIGGIKANNAEVWKYPITISFLK